MGNQRFGKNCHTTHDGSTFEGLFRVNDDKLISGAGFLRNPTYEKSYWGSLKNGKYEGLSMFLVAQNYNDN